MADPLGVSVAFDAPWKTPDPVWTRIDTLAGCRVQGWSIDRGRPTEFDKTGTGTATVRIADRQGLFDPTNLTSPYAGPPSKIVPSKQAAIALQNPVSGTWHTLFRGFVESWRYTLEQTRQVLMLELELVDGFAILARAELEVGPTGDGAWPLPAEVAKGNVGYGYTADTLRDRLEAILGDVDWPPEWMTNTGVEPDLFSGNVRAAPKAYGAGTSALDALFDAVDAEFPGVGNLYMSADGHLHFRGRQARFRPDVAEYGIGRWTVGDPSAWTTDANCVPVAELEWMLGNDNLFNIASATPEKVGAVGSFRPLDPDLDDVAGQYVKDQPSIDAYGRRSVTFDQLQTAYGIASGNGPLVETKLFATYYTANYKDPHSRLSRLVFKSRLPSGPNGPKLWEFLCNCGISDLLTVKTAHPGGGGFNTDFYVEGIHYSCRPGSPGVPIVELSLDVSPRAHYTTNPFPPGDS